MSMFTERESGFETGFAHEADMSFMVASKQALLMGRYVAAKLKITDPVVLEEYAKKIAAFYVHSGHASADRGRESVILEVARHLSEGGVRFTRHDLDQQWDRSLGEATVLAGANKIDTPSTPQTRLHPEVTAAPRPA